MQGLLSALHVQLDTTLLVKVSKLACSEWSFMSSRLCSWLTELKQNHHLAASALFWVKRNCQSFSSWPSDSSDLCRVCLVHVVTSYLNYNFVACLPCTCNHYCLDTAMTICYFWIHTMLKWIFSELWGFKWILSASDSILQKYCWGLFNFGCVLFLFRSGATECTPCPKGQHAAAEGEPNQVSIS